MQDVTIKLSDLTDRATELFQNFVTAFQAHHWTTLEMVFGLSLAGLFLLYIVTRPSAWMRRRRERREMNALRESNERLAQKVDGHKSADGAVLNLLGLALAPITETPDEATVAAVRQAVTERSGALANSLLQKGGALASDLEAAVVARLRGETIQEVVGDAGFKEHALKAATGRATKYVSELMGSSNSETRKLLDQAVVDYLRGTATPEIIKSAEFTADARAKVLAEALRIAGEVLKRRGDGQTWKQLSQQVEAAILEAGKELTAADKQAVLEAFHASIGKVAQTLLDKPSEKVRTAQNEAVTAVIVECCERLPVETVREIAAKAENGLSGMLSARIDVLMSKPQGELATAADLTVGQIVQSRILMLDPAIRTQLFPRVDAKLLEYLTQQLQATFGNEPAWLRTAAGEALQNAVVTLARKPGQNTEAWLKKHTEDALTKWIYDNSKTLLVAVNAELMTEMQRVMTGLVREWLSNPASNLRKEMAKGAEASANALVTGNGADGTAAR